MIQAVNKKPQTQWKVTSVLKTAIKYVLHNEFICCMFMVFIHVLINSSDFYFIPHMSKTRTVYCVINRQRASDCSDCLILIQTFYLAWWFCPASSDRTLGDQVVSLSPGRKGSFSQTGTSMCHRPTKPATLRKSRTTSWRQIFVSVCSHPDSSDAALLMGLLIRRRVPKVCRERGRSAVCHIYLLWPAVKIKWWKIHFFSCDPVMHRSQWCCLSWNTSSQKKEIEIE